MSFSLSASGTKEQVLDSLNSCSGTIGDKLGLDVHALLISHFNEVSGSDPADDGNAWRFEVSASGHSDADSLNLNVSVTRGHYAGHGAAPEGPAQP
jgi:hypothetical protein